MTTAYVGLGSNLGDRRALLDGALARLAAEPGLRLLAASRWIETDPVGGPPQPRYLNGACALESALEPRELLSRMLAIEWDLGRVRGERWAPRTVDLDLLFYGDLVVREPDLEVPHPRAHERAFVLEPLAEIAPQLRHPVLGMTVRDLAMGLRRLAPA